MKIQIITQLGKHKDSQEMESHFLNFNIIRNQCKVPTLIIMRTTYTAGHLEHFQLQYCSFIHRPLTVTFTNNIPESFCSVTRPYCVKIYPVCTKR